MKKCLNTLYIFSQGSYLRKEGECLVVEVEKTERLRLPIHTIGSVVCFGNVLCSPYLLGHCCENNVSVSMLTESGRFLARVTGPVSGNVFLRRDQYRYADCEEMSSSIARTILIGKIANCRSVLQRTLRDTSSLHILSVEMLKESIIKLGCFLDRLKKPLLLDEARGIEGESAHVYFSVFDQLILAQKDAFVFSRRSRRPPLDPVNALLSYLYVILSHDVRAALESVGLDPAVGYLHRDRPGRYSLALDLMEELRPVLADRLVLTLINRQQVSSKDFILKENGAVELVDKARKEVIKAWQERKKTEITHPFTKEKVQMGLVPFIQAGLLARYIRGDIDGYPPFIWK
jgi:CRISPR-associated protein Cas1